MTTPSFEYYTNEYGGRLSAAEYGAGVRDAEAHVNWLIGWKDVQPEQQSAYMLAVCACVDAFAEYGTGALGGFSIGGFRMDGAGEFRTGKDVATNAAYEYLAPAGLLWAGL